MSELDEATELIESLVSQGCYCEADGQLDSMAISAYADGLRWLAERGRVTIEVDVGRRVLARWVERGSDG